MQNNSNSINPIVFNAVGKVYPNRKEQVLHDVSFDVAKGSFVCLVGPSGSGKSTILKLIAGLEEPTSGSVQVPANIGMVFQSGALLPWCTVLENATFGLDPEKYSPEERIKRVAPYLELTGLSDLAEKYPRELSGGQRQRVGIARALAIEPEVLILDEPFSALDIATTDALHEDILDIWSKTKITVVMVSHSIEEAVTLADRVLIIDEGEIKYETSIDIPRPRRAQDIDFTREVNKIRKAFLQ